MVRREHQINHLAEGGVASGQFDAGGGLDDSFRIHNKDMWIGNSDCSIGLHVTGTVSETCIERTRRFGVLVTEELAYSLQTGDF